MNRIALGPKILSILLTLILFLGPLVHAAGGSGGGSDGGTDELVVKFTQFASALLDHVVFEEKDLALLKLGLKRSRIISVSILKDPKTKKPIAHQEAMIAYGSMGLIQLKKLGTGLSFESEVSNNHPISHIIAHELIRASGVVDAENKSPDDAFQLTILKYHLDLIKTSDLRIPNAGVILRPKILHYAWKDEVSPAIYADGLLANSNNLAMNGDENLNLDKKEAQAFVEHVMSQKDPESFFSIYKGFMHRAGKTVWMGYTCFYNFRPNWGLKTKGAMALSEEMASFDQASTFGATEMKLDEFEGALAHAWKYISQEGKLLPNPTPNLGYEQNEAIEYARKAADLKTPLSVLLSGDDERNGPDNDCLPLGLYN